MSEEIKTMIVEIDGKRLEVTPREPGTRDLVQNDATSYTLKHNEDSFHIELIDFDFFSGHCTVKINGEVRKVKVMRDIDVRIEKMGLNASHSRKQRVIHAPMPGLVTNIKVQEGDQVGQGAPLIILEAMKMENVISAPHDAVIKNIRVQVGQAVERGFVMIELQ